MEPDFHLYFSAIFPIVWILSCALDLIGILTAVGQDQDIVEDAIEGEVSSSGRMSELVVGGGDLLWKLFGFDDLQP